MLWLSISVVLLLILAEGLFAAAEMALISLRKGQVDAIAAQGRRGRHVKRLVDDPNQFLSAVQIGVTLTALLASAFGAVTLVDAAATTLTDAGLDRRVAEALAFAAVTLAITYVTLVLGELAPKRLAIQRAERASLILGPALARMAKISRPVIWLLSASTNTVVRLLGGDPHASGERITEDELRDLVLTHEALSREERVVIDDVFAASDRRLAQVMVPRTDVVFLDSSLSVRAAVDTVKALPHSRYPVTRQSSPDNIEGFVHVRDLLAAADEGQAGSTIATLVRPVTRLPASKHALPALSEMRGSGNHLAVVVDEYGGTAGIITLGRLIEQVVGEVRDEYDRPVHAPRDIGEAQEIDGLLNRDDLARTTGLHLPDGPFETVAGYIMAKLGRLPAVGDHVELTGAELMVAAMNGHRIARIAIASHRPEATTRPRDTAPAHDGAPGP